MKTIDILKINIVRAIFAVFCLYIDGNSIYGAYAEREKSTMRLCIF